jgi:hypothetical protein
MLADAIGASAASARPPSKRSHGKGATGVRATGPGAAGALQVPGVAAAPAPEEGNLVAAAAAPAPEEGNLVAAAAAPAPEEGNLVAAAAAPAPGVDYDDGFDYDSDHYQVPDDDDLAAEHDQAGGANVGVGD